MKTVWTQGLRNPTEKEEFEKIVYASKKVLDKLKDIVYNKINGVEKTSLQDYESPSWAYRQADINGYRRAMEEMLSILTIDTE